MPAEDRYPLPWRWEPNGASEMLVAADGTPIMGGVRVDDPIVRVALLHALETANIVHDLTAKQFTACDRNPDCGRCDCCRAWGLFNRMSDEIAALTAARGRPS